MRIARLGIILCIAFGATIGAQAQCVFNEPVPSHVYAPYLGSELVRCNGTGRYSLSFAGSLPPGFHLRNAGYFASIEGIASAPGTYTLSVTAYNSGQPFAKHDFTLQIAPRNLVPYAVADFEDVAAGTPANGLSSGGITFTGPNTYVTKIAAALDLSAPTTESRHSGPPPAGNVLQFAFSVVPPDTKITLQFKRPVAYLSYVATRPGADAPAGPILDFAHIDIDWMSAGVFIPLQTLSGMGLSFDPPTTQVDFRMQSGAQNVYEVYDNFTAYVRPGTTDVPLAVYSIGPAQAPTGAEFVVAANGFILCDSDQSLLRSFAGIPVAVTVGGVTAVAEAIDCTRIRARVPEGVQGSTSVAVLRGDGAKASIPFTVGPALPRRRSSRH